MREIKFRAFMKSDEDVDRKARMIHFDELLYCDEYNHLGFSLLCADRDPRGGGYSNLCISIDDLSPLMQYTGLKDKNGKEIYEGDVVDYVLVDEDSAAGRTYEERFTVMWDGVENRFAIKDLKYHGLSEHQGVWNMKYLGPVVESVEVVGNIYENPDLLKPEGERG